MQHSKSKIVNKSNQKVKHGMILTERAFAINLVVYCLHFLIEYSFELWVLSDKLHAVISCCCNVMHVTVVDQPRLVTIIKANLDPET